MPVKPSETIRLGLKAGPAALNLPPSVKIIAEAPCDLGSATFHSSSHIGAYSYFADGRIGSMRSMGRFCSVAPGVKIGLGHHPTDWLSTHPAFFDAMQNFSFWPESRGFKTGLSRPAEVLKSAPSIGNDVWIGANATILRGVTIGDGAVISAGSVVHKDVPPYTVVSGYPARPLKLRFDKEIVERLQKIQWWRFSLASLRGVPFDNILKAVEVLEKRLDEGVLEEAKYPRVCLERNMISQEI